MLQWLLMLLGIAPEGAARVTGTSLELRGGGAGWVLLAILVLGTLALLVYRREAGSLPRSRRYAMAALRTLLFALILLMFLRPVARFTLDQDQRRRVTLLFDGSASMKIEDARINEPDRKRVALVRDLIEPDKGLDQPMDSKQLQAQAKVQRLDLVRSAFSNTRLNLLARLEKQYDVRAYEFAQTVRELTAPWTDRLSAEAPLTPLGDSLRELIQRSRGQASAGVILVTDGASNTGTDILSAADLAAQENVPLYIWGVGITSARDIAIANISAPEVCFVNDEVPVTVRVRGQGLRGESAKLQLKLADKQVDQTPVKFEEDVEQVISMKFTPDKPGDYELAGSIDPRPDEAVRDNNRATQRLRVIDGKIKVLLIEQSPRWEYKYLQAMLMRDRRVQCRCLLFEGDPGITEGSQSPYLRKFPAKEDLFKYDLIVFGDVDPRQIKPSDLDALSEFVTKFGGGVMVLAGRQFVPQSYKATPLEKMLPVEWTDAASAQADLSTDPVQLQITPAGKRNLMLRLIDDERANAAVWADLPPIFWTARVARAKPAAEVLLVDPNPEKAYKDEKMPVMAIQQYGLGQVLFLGTDNTWRWRRNAGEQHHQAFWGQIVQRMALRHMLGLSKRTQLNLDRQSYVTGQRVTVYARLYEESYAPTTDPTVASGYASDAQGRVAVSLRALPQQPGLYRGEFIAPAPGNYRFWLDRDDKTTVDLRTTEPKMELAESAMNEPGLREMARRSGGEFFREEDLHRLPDSLRLKTSRTAATWDVDLWCQPIYFILMISLLAIEWIIRKRWQLK